MATLHTIISTQSLLSLSKPRKPTSKPIFNSTFPGSKPSQKQNFSRNKPRREIWVLNSSVQEEFDVIPVQSGGSTDQQEGVVVSQVERERKELVNQVGGFGATSEGRLSFEGFYSSAASSSSIGWTIYEILRYAPQHN